MTQSPVAICFVLLFEFLICSGELSLPQNLTVDLLDFQAYIHWSPGQGNLPDTRFTVEIQECGTCTWRALKNCTQLTNTQCHVVFMDTDELMKQYFLRVVATSGAESAEQKYPRSFQPYGDSIISMPLLKVSVQNQSIYVEMRHCLELMPFQLNYSINLTKVSQDESFLVVSTTAVSPWTFPTTQLSPGNYCVSSSVFHKQQMRIHRQSKECVFLPEPGYGGQYLKVVVPFLLVGSLTLLILVAVIYYTRPKPAVCDMPMLLDPSDIKTVVTTMPLPMEMISPLTDLHVLSTSMGGCSEPPAEELPPSWDYTARGTSLYHSRTSASLPSLRAEGLTKSRSPGLDSMYRQALDDDLSCDPGGGGATHSPELPLDELEEDASSQTHWLLHHDVPLDSLVLGLRDTQSDRTLEEHQSKGSNDECGLLDMPRASELHIPTELPSAPLSSPSGYEARDPVIPIS